MDNHRENRTLVHALQLPQDDQWVMETRRLFASSSKWEAVFRRAETLGLGPLLYHQLHCYADDLNIPKETVALLKNAYLQNFAQNMFRGFELKRILRTFGDEGLSAILLKGAALAEAVYNDPGARAYKDLDILVHKRDLARARDLLQRLGYRTDSSIEVQENYRKNHHHLAPMIHDETSVVVELHWNINNRIHVDVDAWWSRSTAASISGLPTRILGWTDMALHLCLHLFSSGETKTTLRGLVDIHRLLVHAGESIDWTLFDNEAKRYGIQGESYAVLQTARNIFDPLGTRISWPVLHTAPSLVALMEKTLFQKDQPNSIPGSLVSIGSEKRWRRKFALLQRRFFPNRAEMSYRYGISTSSWKVYVYYFFRPFQLLWRYGMFTRHLFLTK